MNPSQTSVMLFYCYLAICAIRVAHRHKDLWEELLGLLLCVLLFCYTSGCIWGVPQIITITTHHRQPWFNPQLNCFLMVYKYKTDTLKKSVEDVEYHGLWGMKAKCRGREGDVGETIQDISEAADTCVAGNRTNTPGLIRSTSGRPGGKAITERGSLCCSCRTFQAPKKRADAQGKPDPSLMSLGLPLSPPKPRPSSQFSLNYPRSVCRYKCGSATFHLYAPQVFSHLSVRDMDHLVITQLLHLFWLTTPAVHILRDAFNGNLVWHMSCHAVAVWLAGSNHIKTMTHPKLKNVHQFGQEAAGMPYSELSIRHMQGNVHWFLSVL